jgi:UDP-N-acetyl-D-mannosaminuronic acid dehydrogenase
LGLTFKPNIDDLRESPAVEITEQLSQLGCQILVVEPNIQILPQKLNRHNLVLSPLAEALTAADVVCVLVKHRPFIEAVKDIQRHEQFIDAVGLFV